MERSFFADIIIRGRMARLITILSSLCVLGCAAFLLVGCSKKVTRQKTVFDIDKLFMERPENYSENLKEKGIKLAREKNFDEAIETLKKHTQIEPRDFSGYNALAVSYKNKGDFPQAMTNFEKALNLTDKHEDRAKILANIGNLYYSTEKYQAALGFYKEAAAEFDKNPMYMILIARTFVMLGDYDRARKVLSFVDVKPSRLDDAEKGDDLGLTNYLLAEIYTGLNDEKKVYNNIEEALRANPRRFATKLRQDMQDEKNLFYTLQGDKRIDKMLARLSGRPQ